MTMWRTVALGLVAWLVFLIATLPADRALALAPQMPGVTIGHVQGTLWHGKAGSLIIKGIQLDNLRWGFRPLSLFTGRFEFDLKAGLGSKPVHAIAGTLFSGARYLGDVQLSMPASDVLYRLGIKQVGVSGDLVMDLDDVRFTPGGIPMFSGVTRWAPAEVEAPLVLSLGTATLTTQHDGSITQGDLVATGGVLQVKADVALEATGAYRLNAVITQNGTVPQAVTKFLATFAEYENGSYRLEWSDNLL
ncbi:type II secretion system (T2SS) protein N [Thiogranum longum]|uniref:Type II secretion system protein N n=1 Tax=Thiogranum longum TaxID=1537524 RepID=A0A4R1HGJ1_9GAMM|nr:type II secretion system protein N [Thiogranum longum]TCK19400.1 type II secretion system (T2SS) protein N [Thiogranum longum]